MPVDFSRIGLEGIEAGQQTLSAIEARKASTVLREEKSLENQQTQKLMALDDEASQRLQSIADGSYKQQSSLFDEVDDSSASPLDVVADVYMRGGAPKAGMEFAKAAAEIRAKESNIKKDAFDMQGKKLENIMKVADYVSKTVGVARNQSEWVHGLQQLEAAEVLPPEQLQQLKNMDYDPDVAAYLNEQALTAYQRATMDMTSANQEVQQAQAAERISIAERNSTYAAERLRLAQIASDRVEKAGRASTAPNDAELKSASASVKNQIFKGTVPANLKASFEAGSNAIAARAKALVSGDRSLDWETALNRAIIESQSAGDWTNMVSVDSIAGIPYSKTPAGAKFDPKGKSVETAMPMPLNKGKPAPNKLVKGRFYITAKGRAQWDGSNFTLAEEQ